MTNIPEDIEPILREIDQEMKGNGIKPHQRALHAVLLFGQKFNIELPMVPLGPASSAPEGVARNNHYTQKILKYFQAVYGPALQVDPSEKARVVVLADGDLWELPIPLVFGQAHVTLQRDFLPQQPAISRSPVMINPCQELVHITQKRLQHFSNDDLNEVGMMFSLGFGTRAAFDRFRASDHGFAEAENDWLASVIYLTTRAPAFGQARWSSLQMVEKFLKGLLRCIDDVPHKDIRKCGHNLPELHTLLERSMPALDLKQEIALVQCSDKVRYGEIPVSRGEAYASHKAALNVVSRLGTVRSAN